MIGLRHPSTINLPQRKGGGETTYLVGALCINVVVALQAAHAVLNPRFAGMTNLLFLLPWALAVNLAVTAVLSWMSTAAAPLSSFFPLLVIDWIASLAPLLLLRALRSPFPERRPYLVGLTYAVFVFVKLAVMIVAIWRARKQDARFLRRAIFLSSLVIYAAMTPWMEAACRPDADEPHYLLMMHSIVKDHDFDLANNYNRKDYHAFYPSDLPDHHAFFNKRGEEVPVHDVGIAIALAPGYALDGRMGAMLEENVVAAALAVGLFQMAIMVGSSIEGALLCWALFSFVSPVEVYSSQIYPEITGATLLLWALIAFARYQRTREISALILTGILLSPVLWFSIRYAFILVPICAIIGLYILTTVRPIGKAVRSMLAIALPIAVSLVVFGIFDHRWYGTWMPNAGYLIYVPTMGTSIFELSRFETNAFGLIFDRAFGVLPTAPIYITAVAGIWSVMRRQTVLALLLVLPSILYFLLAAANKYWYGGWAPPTRYILISLVLLAPFAGPVLSEVGSKAIAVLLAVWSFLIAIAFAAFPLTRYTFWDINAGALSQFLSHALGFNYGFVFPSFIRAGLRDYWGAAGWACVAVFCLWLIMSRGESKTVARSHLPH